MTYVSENRQNRFTGMTAAVVVNGSIILAIALSPLVVEPGMPGPIVIGRNIPKKPPPPPTDEHKVAEHLKPAYAPKPIFQTVKPPLDQVKPTDQTQNILTTMDSQGGDDMTESVREVVKPPVVPFQGAMRDSRFARNFQPEYPVAMLRQEVEGAVTIRVLIGRDGRVKQAQVLSATEPAFARATERQALQAWRFKPAMRGDDAVEDWLTLTVRFDIN